MSNFRLKMVATNSIGITSIFSDCFKCTEIPAELILPRCVVGGRAKVKVSFVFQME